ncbi:MAG: type II toxin-antitoxin system VapC family toxin [Candidatus Omnitrophota bacterium]
MDKAYVLDTSAIFTYIEEEDGQDKIEDILRLGHKNKCQIYLSFASLAEIYYISWQEKSEDAAKELVVLVKSLPIQIIDSNERITLSAGRLKALHRISLADAFVAATAIDMAAVLVHKDPELEVISKYIKIFSLPYKTRK